MRFRTMFAIGTLALLGVAVPAAAQRVDPLKLIDFHVNQERENSSIGGTQPEGGKFFLTFRNTQQTYALSIVQRNEGRFDVAVLRRSVAGTDTSYTMVETVPATLGRPAPFRTLPYMTVVIEGTRRAATRVSSLPAVRPIFASYASPSRAISSAFGTCCVTCGNVEACGCAVQHSCGSCCSDRCCPPVKDPDAMLPQSEDQPLAKLGQRPCKPVLDSERLYPQFRPASGAVAIRSE